MSGTKLGQTCDGSIWRSSDVSFTNETFSSLSLDEKVLKGLNKCNFMNPSPVQLQAIPLGRCGLDLVVQSKAGTGKTCVFAVIALESIDIECKLPQVLILTPTREIAVQVTHVIKSVGCEISGLSCKTFIGGVKVKSDKDSLKKCHIAIGTPGRVKQLIECGLLKTTSIRLIVLDEADKLMDDNFQSQINSIYSNLPESKQIIVTSATYPNDLSTFLARYMRSPTFVRLNSNEPALLGVVQYYATTKYHPINHLAFEFKIDHLFTILRTVPFSQCIIFSNFHSRAESLCEKLIANGWPTAHISGEQQQKERFDVISKVKNGNYRVLVSTDLISRGIDCENVNLVINLDVPDDFETYLHRVGRAGRFGQRGIAVTLTSDGKESVLFDKIKSNVEIHQLPDLNSIKNLWEWRNPSDYVNPIDDWSKDFNDLIFNSSETTKNQRLSLNNFFDDYIRFSQNISSNEGFVKIPLKSRKIRKIFGLT